MTLATGLKRQVPTLRYTVADSVHTAPGWRIVDDDFYTCIPPVDRPVDPAIERLVHAFDPTAIFLWRKQLYLPPGKSLPVLFCHNALGRFISPPRRELQIFHVEMPPGAKHPKPNELLWVWEKFDETLMFHGGPGGYMPWDGEIVRYLRRDHNLMTPATEMRRIMDRRHEEEQVRSFKARAEQAAEHAEIDAWINRQLDKPGDTQQALIEYEQKRKAGYMPVRSYSFRRG